MIALVIVFGAIGAGLYLAENAGLTARLLGGPAPLPLAGVTPAAFAADAALAHDAIPAAALPGVSVTPRPTSEPGPDTVLAPTPSTAIAVDPTAPTPTAPPSAPAPTLPSVAAPELAPGAPRTDPSSPTPFAAPEGAPGGPSPAAPGSPAAPSVAELLASADAALRAGDAEAALEGYRAVVAADGDNPYGYAGAARAALALDEPEDAISFATRAVAHRQRRAGFRVLLGDAFEAHGEHERALEEWREALEIEPENRDARTRLGE